MPRLSAEDLKIIKEQYEAVFTLRKGGFRVKITVHMGTCGIAIGARQIMEVVLDEIGRSNALDIFATTSGCAGICNREPMITIEVMDELPIKYGPLTPDKMKRIFREHVLNGCPVEEYAIAAGHEGVY